MTPSFDCRRFNQNIPPSVVVLQQCHCRNRHRGKLHNVSPPSVLFDWTRIFFTIHRRQTQKMMDQNFEIRILWFLRIFWNFEKASRGPSAADLDHYGRCQTRSEWGPCDQVSSNRLTLKGRSASQRHKDRQTRLKWGPFRFAIGPTNWAQNNCPSGLQSGQKSAA